MNSFSSNCSTVLWLKEIKWCVRNCSLKSGQCTLGYLWHLDLFPFHVSTADHLGKTDEDPPTPCLLFSPRSCQSEMTTHWNSICHNSYLKRTYQLLPPSFDNSACIPRWMCYEAKWPSVRCIMEWDRTEFEPYLLIFTCVNLGEL